MATRCHLPGTDLALAEHARAIPRENVMEIVQPNRPDPSGCIRKRDRNRPDLELHPRCVVPTVSEIVGGEVARTRLANCFFVSVPGHGGLFLVLS